MLQRRHAGQERDRTEGLRVGAWQSWSRHSGFWRRVDLKECAPLKFSEIAIRLTGISTPLGGIPGKIELEISARAASSPF